MFTEARIQLTVWYLAIIMAISLSFSGVIYAGINRELVRFDSLQKARQARVDQINLFLKSKGLLAPSEIETSEIDPVGFARIRIITVLGFINLAIFVIAGAGGYFLAGRTLEPIRRNMEGQKAFVSDASHELRTPLTSLKTEIEVGLRDKKMNIEDARVLLKSNLEDVNRMQTLSNYLLTMNRYEDGKDLKMIKVDLKEIALKAIGKREVVKELKSSMVTANYDSLVELVSVLLDNAFKYGRGKEIKVKVGDKKVSVIDMGMGISESDLPHIFDRFYRSDKSRGTEGYGLGLSIAMSIAQKNGGNLKVKSLVGKGSTFTLTL